MYKRLTRGLNDAGILIHEDESPYDYIDPNHDAYLSIYSYTQEQYDQFQKTGTISGILDVATRRLVWDLDSKDLDLALNETKTLLETLRQHEVDGESIDVYYSGSKGFEVSLEVDQPLTPKESKAICSAMAQGLTTFDRKIYNASRQMRLPLTKHQVSGLFKTPLKLSEFSHLTIPKIQELAKHNRHQLTPKQTIQLTPKLIEYKEYAKTKEVEPMTLEFNDISEIDWKKKPKDLSGAKWLLELGFIPEGYRNHAMMILASTYRSLGYSKEKAYYLLKSVSELYAKRNSFSKCSKEEIWNNVITQVYGPNWSGGTYSERSDELLRGLAEQVPDRMRAKGNKEIIDISGVSDLFKSYVKDIDTNRLTFGIDSLDEHIYVMVGRFYVLGGSCGSGKTSAALQILNNMSLQGIPCMFFSFDMSLNDVYQKLIQKHFKISSKKLYEMCKDPKNLLEFDRVIKENYANVRFSLSSGMNIEKIRNTIEQTEQELGKEIKLVVVDYFDLVQSEYSDPTQKSMYIAQGMKAIATEMSKCVVCLNQPNKANQKINQPVESYSAMKGSGAISELANAVMWIYRPGASPKDFTNDKWYVIDCMKNRHGALFSLPFAWDGVSGTITELDDNGIDELNGFIKNKGTPDDF